MPDGEPTITYAIRDLFEKINEQLMDIRGALIAKADEAKVTSMEARIVKLESDKQRLIGLAIGISLVSGGLAGPAMQAILGAGG